jgi:putative tryptophan/tyrosine transport system substrate-binding protein
MRRRTFIQLVGGATAWPLVARAQQSRMPTIGFLSSGSGADRQDQVEAFLKGLREAGYKVDGNVTIEYWWAEDRDDQFQRLAKASVQQKPDVLAVSSATALVLMVKAATTAIPIVFCVGGDPVKNGLVASMNRPGGNVTGVSFLSNALAPKRLEILRDLLPNKTIVAHLVNPKNANSKNDIDEMSAAGRSVGCEVMLFNATTTKELDEAFSSIAQHKIGGLILASDSTFFGQRANIIAMANRHKIATAFDGREYVTSGGLVSYGANRSAAFRAAGVQVGRILNGATPADLPVEQPTTLELTINLKTAKALGFDVPLQLQQRADEVIE